MRGVDICFLSPSLPPSLLVVLLGVTDYSERQNQQRNGPGQHQEVTVPRVFFLEVTQDTLSSPSDKQ